MSDLPAWPDREDLQPLSPHLADQAASQIVYERKMKEAALARLKVAVELLQRIAGDDDHYTNHYGTEAGQTLATIGPLP